MVNYLDKFNVFLKEKGDKYLLGDYFCNNTLISKDTILKYIKNVPEDYLEFIKCRDSFSISGIEIRFLGFSEDAYIESIESLIKEYDMIYEDLDGEESPFKIGSGRLPIALDSGGNVIYINEKGEVYIFYNDGGEHEFIAGSFEEFMNDVIFGEKYREYYGLSDKECEEDEWYQYLKLKGWVKG